MKRGKCHEHKKERAKCHHANQNWIGRESMNWHFYRSYSLLIVASAEREGAHGWKWEAEMPRAEIRVYHSSRVRLRGFVLKTTARLKSCELTVNT
jgi:hypothetical protein